ncbi:CrcB family protein [Yimella radicis]
MNRQPPDTDAAAVRSDRLVLPALVFVGGSAGTTARALLSERFPMRADGWPWTTFVINVLGALLLGLLLGVLAHLADDSGARRRVRLGLGTGLLGGFTTYSAFAVEVVERDLGAGLAYATASVVAGVLAAGIGLRLPGMNR